jgi:uncharacterized protein YlxW (UPF0749 family)
VAKSASEQARELAVQLEILRERDAARARESDRTQAEVRDLEAELRRERDARSRLETEVSALKQQLQDHIKHTDTSDSRRWGLVVALVVALFGAVCSLASGLIVALARK